ncbi:MAG: glycosyltransferase family 4 protein [Candidatus Colwellbacteria bacterium]
MKIIYFTPSIEPYDGYSRYALDVISRIASVCDTVVVCNKKSGKLPGVTEYELLRPPSYYFSNPLLVLADVIKVRKVLKKEFEGDTIIHFTAEGYALFLPFLGSSGFKSIMTTHGTYSVLPLASWKTRQLYKRAYQKLDKVVSVSGFTKKHLLKHAGEFVPESKVQVITNGVDFIDRVLPDRSGRTECTVITVGQVKYRKGGHNLIRVAKMLKDRNIVRPKVIFVGNFNPESEYGRSLIRYVEENGLQGVVKFAGRVSQEEKDEFYKKADVFALLSENEDLNYEGYPLVFHEAASWGLPAIGSFNCGAEDAIKNGETGFLVDPGDYASVAGLVEDIFRKSIINPEVCKKWAAENDWSKKDLMSMYRL